MGFGYLSVLLIYFINGKLRIENKLGGQVMIKKFKSTVLAAVICSMLFTIPVSAANKFSFEFTDLYNHTYPTTWLKENAANYYKITLNRYNGLKANTMSSANIFGCRMKDMSVGPVVDRYHTFSNYVTNYQISYISNVNRGDVMALAAKKDDASTSGDALRISGTVEP